MQIEEGHLGGYFEGGDDGTFYPHMWNWLLTTLNIKSVLDLGCAEGHSAKFFKDKGCSVLGIEGSKQAVKNSVIPKNTTEWDFNAGPFITDHHDLIWCCEVLEHIEEQYAQNILDTMKNAEYIVVTAAEPGQGGYHHVNCQPASYWICKISQMGFQCDAALTRMARSITTIEKNPLCHFSRTGWVFKKETPRRHSKYASLTFISGDVFASNSSIEVYLQSLQKNWPYDKIVFTHSLNPENRERLERYDIQIIDVDPNKVHDVINDRWFHYWQFLCNKDYEIVMITDAKDVLFQDDPIKRLKQKDDFLILSSEGQNHEDSNWNIEEQEKFQSANNLNYPYLGKPILNGGFQIGSLSEVLHFTYLMNQGMRLNKGSTSDQAFLNSMYDDFQHNPRITISDPVKNSLIATGESIKEGTAKYLLEMSMGNLVNPNLDQPYCIVHQWDRTPFAENVIHGLQ